MPLNKAQIESWIKIQQTIVKLLKAVDFEASTGSVSYQQAVDETVDKLTYEAEKNNLKSFPILLSELQLELPNGYVRQQYTGLAISFTDMPLLGKLLGADSNNIILPTGSKIKNGEIINRNGDEIQVLGIMEAFKAIEKNGGLITLKSVTDAITKFQKAQKPGRPVRPSPAATTDNKMTTPKQSISKNPPILPILPPDSGSEKNKLSKEKLDFLSTIINPYKGKKATYDAEQAARKGTPAGTPQDTTPPDSPPNKEGGKKPGKKQ